MEKKIKLKKLKTPRATNRTFHFESVVKFKLDSEAERNKTTGMNYSLPIKSFLFLSLLYVPQTGRQVSIFIIRRGEKYHNIL